LPNHANIQNAYQISQRLKSALWYQIGQFVDAEGAAQDFNATPQFIGALTELVYTQLGT
jgi:centromere protein S